MSTSTTTVELLHMATRMDTESMLAFHTPPTTARRIGPYSTAYRSWSGMIVRPAYLHACVIVVVSAVGPWSIDKDTLHARTCTCTGA